MNKRPGIVIANHGTGFSCNPVKNINSLRGNFEFLMTSKFLLIGLPFFYSQLSLFKRAVSLKAFFLFWSFNVRTSDIQLTLQRWQLGSNHFFCAEICAKWIVIDFPVLVPKKRTFSHKKSACFPSDTFHLPPSSLVD
jgi:hypothetical protein